MNTFCLCFLIFRHESKKLSLNKVVNNTYEARLERLKDELNPPTVSEFIQMHKSQIQQHSDTKEIENSKNVLEQHNSTEKPPKAIIVETESIENQRYFVLIEQVKNKKKMIFTFRFI